MPLVRKSAVVQICPLSVSTFCSSTTRSQARFSTRSPVTQPVLPTRVGICTFPWTGSSIRFTASLGASTTTRLHAEELLRAEDQKLSCPESHSSCHIAAGDELSAKKQVVKMAPTVKPTPITINALSPCSSVSGRLSTKRRFAIDWISLLTFCQSNQLSGNRPFHSSTE